MELPKGPPFASVGDAYEFSFAVRTARQGGRSNTPDRDKGDGGGAAPKDYQILDAITIWSRAEACDPGDPERPSWFELYFMPPPKEAKPEWTAQEMKILGKAIRNFECLLCDIRFLPDCGRKRGRKCRKRNC